MLSEKILTTVMETVTDSTLKLQPTSETRMPAPVPGQRYMLYMHVPFCQRLCPYCSFNRFPFEEKKAKPYFANMRKEMLMLADQGYDFDSIYVGGGTPTIMLDELCETIDLARKTFHIKEVSSETNPNHLIPEYLTELQGRVQRLSVGVQSFDNGLLKQMDRYDKYGSGEEILERIKVAAPYFKSLNVDMIFNFPAQTEEILREDLRKVIECGSGQTTFYPLMCSKSVRKSLARTVGKVDYAREARFYQIIDETLSGSAQSAGQQGTGSQGTGLQGAGSQGAGSLFTHGSAWTFNRVATACAGQGQSDVEVAAPLKGGKKAGNMIDEYVVDYEEYPAIGSGGITYLGNSLYVNTFSVNDYNAAVEAGNMSLMLKTNFSKRNRMRYRFMMQLFGLRLDKKQFKKDFGCSVEAGLPAEMAFMRASGAFATNTPDELTLTPKGRYLMVVMMRQFFIGVNNLRDQARAALKGEERELLFGAGVLH